MHRHFQCDQARSIKDKSNFEATKKTDEELKVFGANWHAPHVALSRSKKHISESDMQLTRDLIAATRNSGMDINDLSSLTAEDLYDKLRKMLGPSMAAEIFFNNIDNYAEFCDLLIAIFENIGAPFSFFGEAHIGKLFDAATLHPKRRIIFLLSLGGHAEFAQALISRVPSAQRDRLRRLALMAEADRKLTLEAFRRNLRSYISESDDSEALFGSLISTKWDEGYGIIQGSHPIITIPNEFQRRTHVVIPELNSIIFGEGSRNASNEIRISDIIGYFRLLLEDERYEKLKEKLGIISSRSELVPEVGAKLFCAIIVELVRRGIPLSLETMAFALKTFTSTGRHSEITPFVLASRIELASKLGRQSFFELRRACAFAPTREDRVLLARRFSECFLDTSEENEQRIFFLDTSNEIFEDNITEDMSRQVQSFIKDCAPQHYRFSNEVSSAVRPRVAVMISGQLRCFKSVVSDINKFIIKPLNADTFIATWDNSGLSAGAHNEIFRIIDRSIYDAIPVELRDMSKFLSKFTSLERELGEIPSSSEELLRSMQLDAHVKIVDERKFERLAINHFSRDIIENKTTLNQVKMFFMLRLCGDFLDQRVMEAGKKYDIVIRVRPDLNITRFNYFDFMKGSPESDVVTVPHTHPVGVADTFAVGSHIAMRKYFSAFDHLWAARDFGAFKNGQNLYGEAFVFDSLSLQGVRFLNDVEMLHYSFSSAFLSKQQTLESMLADLDEGDPLSIKLRAMREAHGGAI